MQEKKNILQKFFSNLLDWVARKDSTTDTILTQEDAEKLFTDNGFEQLSWGDLMDVADKRDYENDNGNQKLLKSLYDDQYKVYQLEPGTSFFALKSDGKTSKVKVLDTFLNLKDELDINSNILKKNIKMVIDNAKPNLELLEKAILNITALSHLK